jgi:hypothetical protein
MAAPRVGFFFFLKHVIVVRGHIVTFIELPTVYLNLLYHSALSSFPPSYSSSKRSLCSIFIKEHVVFPPYLPSSTLMAPPTHWCQPPDLMTSPSETMGLVKERSWKTPPP